MHVAQHNSCATDVWIIGEFACQRIRRREAKTQRGACSPSANHDARPGRIAATHGHDARGIRVPEKFVAERRRRREEFARLRRTATHGRNACHDARHGARPTRVSGCIERRDAKTQRRRIVLSSDFVAEPARSARASCRSDAWRRSRPKPLLCLCVSVSLCPNRSGSRRARASRPCDARRRSRQRTSSLRLCLSATRSGAPCDAATTCRGAAAIISDAQ